MKNHNLKMIILPVLSALLLGLSRMPWHLGFISYCAFIPLFYFFENNPRASEVLKAALLFSVVYTLTSLQWITLVTLPGFFGMMILFSLYFLIVFHFIRLIRQRNYSWRFAGFVLIWLSFEHLQQYGQFCFPWFHCGYSLSDYIIMLQPAELGGVSLISFFIILTNIFIYKFLRSRRISWLIIIICIHLFWTGASAWRYHTLPLEDEGEKIALVQVSIPQNHKWKAAYRDTTLQLYRDYTGKVSDDASLIILSESAIPGYVLKRGYYRRYVDGLVRRSGRSIFTGFPHYEEKPGSDDPSDILYYNSCTLFDTTGNEYPRYDKNILVPFGERIPLMSIIPILNQVDLGQANWEYGQGMKTYNHNGLDFMPQICFEIAFPWFNAKMARQEPDFIVNLTNDAWFFHSAGMYQHSIMTRMRAIETRTQYYRAANTGISLIVNPRGDILQKSGIFTREVIEDNVYTYPHKTLFVRYFYLLPDLLVLFSALLLLWSILKKS